MMDALSTKPLVNDTYAKLLMGEEGLLYWENFKKYTSPNGSNVARCYLIDSWIRKQLEINPETTVILIGAGLDSRAFRIPHGKWVELDEPGVIEYKEKLLPSSSCKNSLRRISIDFEHEPLVDKLSLFSQAQPVIIVVEGVLMYLSHEQKSTLFKTLTSLFKNHLLLCDLMTLRFFNAIGKKGLHQEIVKSGASFRDLEENPEENMIRYGYQLQELKSNVITASDFGLLPFPRFVIKYLMKRLLMGYSSYQFSFGK
jgi:methyltransferase (TIGR00027 family)